MPKIKPSVEQKQEEKLLRITLVKSPIGYSKRHKATIRALGFRRMNQTVEQVDRPTLWGMIAFVRHLVEVEAVEENEA
jgi:large subunit ribosomal protein L30